jgi:hypothetical protein
MPANVAFVPEQILNAGTDACAPLPLALPGHTEQLLALFPELRGPRQKHYIPSYYGCP